MTHARFVEANCQIGGCACPCWADWYDGRREFAKAHPRATDLTAIKDDTEYSEALDALAEELDGEYVHPVPACQRQGCEYATAA